MKETRLKPNDDKQEFIEKYRFLYGPSVLNVSLKDHGLPINLPNNTIAIYKENLKKFADDYMLLASFIGFVLEKDDFCLLDILNYVRTKHDRRAEGKGLVKLSQEDVRSSLIEFGVKPHIAGALASLLVAKFGVPEKGGDK